jgi:hypothetical protein
MDKPRSLIALALAAAAAVPGTAAAQSSPTVYKCPGPPVLYTDALTAQEAKEKGCTTIEGAPITVIQAPRPRPAAAPAAPAPAQRERVDPADQRARDSDARRILTEELKREEERLAQLQKEFNGGEPERRGDERNFAKYQERVADLKASIQRKEADIAALRRELAKLPQ